MDDPIERFERRAAQFCKETGYCAPGKDVPAALGYDGYDEERWAAWKAWCESTSKSQPSEKM